MGNGKKEQPLHTPRLLLRRWCDADAEALFRYASDPRVGPAAGWAPHTSVDHSREVIRGVLSAPDTYAIVLRATGEPVGSIGLMLRGMLCSKSDEPEWVSVEMGYWLGVPHWGQGLATEAARALLQHVFGTLRYDVVWCGYYDGNERSRRVQEKCGFRYARTTPNVPCDCTGDLRTEHFSKITREEWEKLKIKN